MNERSLAVKPILAPTVSEREEEHRLQRWEQEEESFFNERARRERESAEELVRRLVPGLEFRKLIL